MNNITDYCRNNNIYLTENENMSSHCTFKLGGSSRYFSQPDSIEKVIKIINYCRSNGIEFFIAGNLSNTVFSDSLFDGVVISLVKLNTISINRKTVLAQAGVLSQTLINVLFKNRLHGLEFLSCIPATVGGITYMNAGAYGSETKDFVKYVVAYDYLNNSIVRFYRNECDFSYRHSIFHDSHYVILYTVFEFIRSDIVEIKNEIDKYTKYRIEKQPLELPNAGSIFKRPEGLYVGKAIEDLGLKGYTVGGCMISTKHAGFIVNTGNATCRDLLKLIEYIKDRIHENYNVNLEEEIIIVGK